ncbi:MAG: glycosyltransferase [Acidobacteriota bacterium]|nr:glycosyltransferase [Acidobacteriota bacterium]
MGGRSRRWCSTGGIGGTAAAEAPGTAADLAVVVITRNRSRELCRTLTKLTGPQTSPAPRPIVVVDNGSTDDSVRQVRARFPQVEVVPLGSNFGAAGRNIGVGRVATPFVAFCDDDTWWSPGSLERAVEVMRRHPRLAVVTARIVVEPEGRTDPVSEEMAASPIHRTQSPGRGLVSFLAGASVVRRRAFEGVGGFAGRLLIGGEEELLGADLLDAGWDMAYLDGLEIHHAASVQRDAHLRRRQGIRNTLWFTWSRRPIGDAWRRTAGLLRQLPPDAQSARAVGEALAGWPWVLGQRRGLRPEVAAELSLLDGDLPNSRARRYVS